MRNQSQEVRSLGGVSNYGKNSMSKPVYTSHGVKLQEHKGLFQISTNKGFIWVGGIEQYVGKSNKNNYRFRHVCLLTFRYGTRNAARCGRDHWRLFRDHLAR